ncbi:hypothetical protein [Clostridium sp.]|uniref:NUDIX hydrolase n=1 Tax=Clostridium sp. TaxID=1506 RepID=UPI003216AE2A
MRDTIISKYDDRIAVYYTKNKISLPENYSSEVEKHWAQLKLQDEHFFRGDAYTITNIEINENKVNIFVSLTDYAHFLYTIHRKKFIVPDCRVIHTSVLIETIDNKFAIGVMNTGTAAPNKLQLIGGGIDKNDIEGDVFDLHHNIKKEIFEELGIDVADARIVKSLNPYVLKSGGEDNFLSAIFKMELLINEDELAQRLVHHNEVLILKGENPEIKSLIFIDISKKAVEKLVNEDSRYRDRNLNGTLMAATGIIPIEDYLICI